MYELLWYHWFYCIFKPFPDFHSRVIFHYRSLNHARRSLMPSGRHQSHVLWLSFVIQHSLMSRLGCGTMEKNSLMISDSWVRHILQEQLITNGVGRISLGFRKARIAINSTLVQVTFVIAKSSRVMKLILAVWSYLGANSVLFLKENCDHLQTDKWRTDQPWKNSNTWATHTHTSTCCSVDGMDTVGTSALQKRYRLIMLTSEQICSVTFKQKSLPIKTERVTDTIISSELNGTEKFRNPCRLKWNSSRRRRKEKKHSKDRIGYAFD